MKCSSIQRLAYGRTQANAVRAVVPSTRFLVKAAASPGASSDNDNSAPEHQPLPLSLFMPYRHLPPNGKLIHDKEKPRFSGGHAYVYDTKCPTCDGTGFARQSRHRSRSRGSLRTCVVCIGLGHVRRTTARFEPDTNGGVELMTLARVQRLPGEPEQETLRTVVPELDTNTRLRQATEAQEAAQAAAAKPAEPTKTNNIVPAPSGVVARQVSKVTQASV